MSLPISFFVWSVKISRGIIKHKITPTNFVSLDFQYTYSNLTRFLVVYMNQIYDYQDFFPVRARGVMSRMCTSVSPAWSKKATKWGGVSESPYKKVGPVSVLGRAR